jgi:hypothetical protein
MMVGIYNSFRKYMFRFFIVRYHTGASMKLNARILHLEHIVYL